MVYYSENQEAEHATTALLANRASLTQYPPPPLSKQAKSQKNDRQAGSCLDKTMLAREARYQKNLCHRNPAPTSPNPNCCNRVLQHYLQANFSMFWRSSLPIRGIRSRLGFRFCNGFGLNIPWDKTVINHIFGKVKLALSVATSAMAEITPKQTALGCNVRMSRRSYQKHDPATLSLYN